MPVKIDELVLKMTGQAPGSRLIGDKVTEDVNKKILSENVELNDEDVPDTGVSIVDDLSGEDSDINDLGLEFSSLWDPITNLWRFFCGITQIGVFNPKGMSQDEWTDYQENFKGNAATRPTDDVFGDHMLTVARRRWIRSLQNKVKENIEVSNDAGETLNPVSDELKNPEEDLAGRDPTGVPLGSSSNPRGGMYAGDGAGPGAQARGGGAGGGAANTEIKASVNTSPENNEVSENIDGVIQSKEKNAGHGAHANYDGENYPKNQYKSDARNMSQEASRELGDNENESPDKRLKDTEKKKKGKSVSLYNKLKKNKRVSNRDGLIATPHNQDLRHR